MKVYCDTTVLVAASVSSHPHHAQSLALLKHIRGGKLDAVISAHGIAEFYAVLTRAPLTPPVYPSEAWRLLAENILPHFHIAALSATQYTSLLRQAAEKGMDRRPRVRRAPPRRRHQQPLQANLHL
jgi:predicted nucleic acid-binding protein